MKIELIYFSGTGNSYKVLDVCRDILESKGHQVSISSSTEDKETSEDADLIGFCFPVYAFDIPRICKKYLSRLNRSQKQIKTFVIITAGDPLEAGFSFRTTRRILSSKGYDPIYSDVIHMPSNWVVEMDPPSKEDSEKIIAAGILKAKLIAENMMSGKFIITNLTIHQGIID